MNKKQAVQRTRGMWQWLANNPGCTKDEYLSRIPEEHQPKGKLKCYCCDVFNDCEGCPLAKPFKCGGHSMSFLPEQTRQHQIQHAANIVLLCDVWLRGYENGV